MDNKGKKIRLKSSRNREPLLKPDVILITKDVMVPLKIPPPSGNNFPAYSTTLKDSLKLKPRVLKPRSLGKPLLSSRIPGDNSRDQSLMQEGMEVRPGDRGGQDISSKSPPYCVLRDTTSGHNFFVDRTKAVTLEREELSPGVFDLDEKDWMSAADKPGTPKSSRHSFSSETTAETHSTNSRKSFERIEASFPKLPLSVVSSSESENTVSLHKRRPTIPPVFDNNSKNIVDDEIETQSHSDVVEKLTGTSPNSKLHDLRSRHEFQDQKSIITETESSALHHSHTEELVEAELDHSCITSIHVDLEESKDYLLSDKNDDAVQNIVDSVAIENERIVIDVECLLQRLITNICNLEDLWRIDNCKEDNNTSLLKSSSFNEEKEIHNYSEYDSMERIPKRIGFRYSSEDLLDIVSPNLSCSEKELDLINAESDNEEQPETVYDNIDVRSNRSEEEIEIKYSWQIITRETQGSNDMDNFNETKCGNENNTKQTCTEDLCPNEPEFRYSWQELTAKYLARNDTGDGSAETNQPAPNAKDKRKDSENTEFKKNSEVMTNFNREETSKGGESIGRIVGNSPLNNIISSMLPEIKLIRRPNYLGSHVRSDYTKSPATYSSVSSIKHVIANLNDMVTTQKHVLDAYVRNHRLDPEPALNPVVNRFEKVEIFPSTLHVLGDYIVRDIRPADMNGSRRLLDANNDTVLLSDNPATVQKNGRLDDTVNNIRNEKIPPANAKHDILNPDLFPTSLSQIPADPQDSEFPSILNPSNYCSPIFTADEIRDLKEADPQLTEQNWEPVIVDMEEMTELSVDAAQRMGEDRDAGNEAVPHTKNTGPLKPRLQVSFTETKEAGDSTTRRDELLSRLEGAMSRLKQSEQHIDANWNLDYSVLDVEEDVSEKEVKLPKQVEEHIKDIIKSAGEYLAKLEEQLNDLRSADNQIINSSERTFKDIDDSYQLFMDNLCQEINKRRNLVRLETEVFKYEGLAPLRACKQEVDAQIRSTQHLIVLTETMLTHPVTFNRERLGKIITATSHMGRIPAVPMPEELPYVTFSPPNEDLKKEISDRISCLGCVLRMGPAQFTEVCERPACLQLKWHVADPEFASEEQTFVVQKAVGEITEPTSTAFETVYVGQETSCFVRDLPVDHPITLRVGIQVSDTAWSVYRIAQTSIPAYNWDVDNSDYLITNSGRIATKVTQNLTTLLSRSPQFDTNYIIEFKFLEAASGTDAEGIGLVFEPGGVNDDLKRIGALLITPNGNIFMNGDQKLMQLPKMELGTRIVFTSEEKDEDTLRMTIECGNKAVTYDWTVRRPLHFAARFSEQNKWNLMVK